MKINKSYLYLVYDANRKEKPTIFQVADYFRYCVDYEAGSSLPNLKLQKLCYYAQGWHLAFFNTPLFEESLYAQERGPVCRELWEKYKDYGTNNIPHLEQFDGKGYFSKDQRLLLREVWDTYGCFDGRYLQDLCTHELPWQRAFSKEHSNEPGLISLELMHTFFNVMAEDH